MVGKTLTLEQILVCLKNPLSTYTFNYNGVGCGVDHVGEFPCDGDDYYFDVWYDRQDNVVKSVDELLNAPVFNGKALKDIYKDCYWDFGIWVHGY